MFRANHSRGIFQSASFVFVAVLAVLVWALPAADWPHWRGPKHDGTTTETNWLAHWPTNQTPKVAWRTQVGRGHSAVSVRAGRAFTVGWDGARDTVFCFDASSGKLLWKQSHPCRNIVQWSGPRATPAVDDTSVFTLSQHGLLAAWSVKDGALKWKHQFPGEMQPDDDYGFAWSPVLTGEFVVLNGGPGGIALRRESGEIAWGNERGKGACASPAPFDVGGTRGLALVLVPPDRDSALLMGVDAVTGRELWRSPPWREKWGALCADLLVSEGRVFVTSAEQHNRCARFRIEGNRLVEEWSNTRLASYTGNIVLLGAHLHGVNKAGLLKCLDWATGEERWAERGFGSHGTLIAADGLLLVQNSDTGELVVLKPNPSRCEELRRTKVFSNAPKSFTAPVLADGRIYARCYQGEVVCVDLTGK